METEIKAKVKSFTQIEENLAKIGAKFVSEENTKDLYYFLPNTILDTYEKHFRIRLYLERGIIKLGYYIGIDEYSAHDYELEFDEGQLKAAKELVNALGYQKVNVEVKKIRKKYKLKQFNIVLDKLEDVGNFMEIEIMDDDANTSVEKIKILYNKLNIKEENFIETRYPVMFWKEQGIYNKPFQPGIH